MSRHRGYRSNRLVTWAAILAVLALPAAVPVDVAAVGDTPSVVCERRVDPVPRGPATLVDQRPAPGAEERITEFTLRSPALAGETKVNVLFPPEYAPDERYPVLYLLHGAAGSHRDWQVLGDVVRVVDETRAAHDLPPFLVVMPDAGDFGFYTDWFGLDVDGHNDPGPAPAWTTYHIGELLPWVDATLPVVPGRSGRAVAGLSMGGFGTMSYATRFPDLFAAAGSFSGALNPSYAYPAGNVFLTGASAPFNGRGFDQCIWGEFATQEVHWLGADPVHLAGNLAGADVALYVASGGGYVERPEGFVTDPVEQTCYQMSRAFTDALADRQVPVTVDFYAEGGHAWEYWQRGVREFLPIMFDALAAEVDTRPAAFDFRSVEPTFSVWDWTFQIDRDVTEFLYLSEVGAGGLRATGSGRLAVTTAPEHRPGVTYRVTQDDTGPPQQVVADDAGRLTFTVDLGPSHDHQQVLFDEHPPPDWKSVTVVMEEVTA